MHKALLWLFLLLSGFFFAPYQRSNHFYSRVWMSKKKQLRTKVFLTHNTQTFQLFA